MIGDGYPHTRGWSSVGSRVPAKHQFTAFKDRLDPGDPLRPVGAQGGDCLVPVSDEQRPHGLRELRRRPFEVPPWRHTPNGCTDTDSILRGAGEALSADRICEAAKP